MPVVSGTTYRFTNVQFPAKALNVYASGTTISARKNVCLYDNTPSDVMQQWLVTETVNGGYVLKCAANNGYGLRYSDGTNSASCVGNADVEHWSNMASADSLVNFEYLGNNRVKIKHHYTGRYLTAHDGEEPTSNNVAIVNVAGNVYWADDDTLGNKQIWNISPSIDEVIIPSSKYEYICQQTYNWVNGAYNITTARFQDYGCAAVTATMFMQIMANNPSITPEDLFEWGVITSSNGYPYALWNTSGAPVNYTFYKIADNWSSAKNHIYNQLSLGKPVIIHLHEYEGTSRDGHFVVGIGMKANTTVSNMTYDDIYVLDPWTPNNETLSDTMNTNPLWANFDNIRVAV